MSWTLTRNPAAANARTSGMPTCPLPPTIVRSASVAGRGLPPAGVGSGEKSPPAPPFFVRPRQSPRRTARGGGRGASALACFCAVARPLTPPLQFDRTKEKQLLTAKGERRAKAALCFMRPVEGPCVPHSAKSRGLVRTIAHPRRSRSFARRPSHGTWQCRPAAAVCRLCRLLAIGLRRNLQSARSQPHSYRRAHRLPPCATLLRRRAHRKDHAL